MSAWSKQTIAAVRRNGREVARSWRFTTIKAERENRDCISVGEWWVHRPSTWAQEAILHEDGKTWQDCYELDLHWLTALNSVLTKWGWTASIGGNGKYNDNDLVLTRSNK